MSTELNFTKAALTSLEVPPKGKRCYYRDTRQKGLIVQQTSTGRLTFYVYRWVQGKPERIRVGDFPDMSIDQARRKAQEIMGEIAQGKNPNDTKRSLRQEMTLGELFTTYLDRHARQHKKTWEEDQGQFDRYLSDWKQRRLQTIKRVDIQKRHSQIGEEHGIYAANRTLALLSVLFNKAVDWGWEGGNPALGIKRFREKSRERFLQPDELPRFFQALAKEPNITIRDYVLLSLLTGARKSNILEMRWSEVNLERSTWFIPDTKNGTSQTVPLVPEAAELLQVRKESAESEWVFPGAGKTGHLVEPKKAWAKILERAGLTDLRLHDLRRSLGSWQAATGASLSIIGKSLNHKNVNTTSIYARLNIDPVRQSMEKAVEAMFATMAPPSVESDGSEPGPSDIAGS
ncbi:tyrosine-type recombinase/integrase [Thiorhodovibrio frisius]|uniref:Site-specific recombinase XerD n=1 Tax=Thiorhodovibrio frisius TaxID=631362 RepID=H8Z7C4_9GAMM|nr:site-specific integrase [Thiorhodovibrio frisius]EIC19840.1 site-specific recombinase XerD [Thiorhodovibrio frisius]WPL20567.1 integrase [Thiorhodovibrio frisius]